MPVTSHTFSQGMNDSALLQVWLLPMLLPEAVHLNQSQLRRPVLGSPGFSLKSQGQHHDHHLGLNKACQERLSNLLLEVPSASTCGEHCRSNEKP